MSAERKTEQIPQWKQEEVAALVDLIESYDSVGIVDVAGIPSRQLQEMRANLYGTAELRMSRNTLIRRALQEVDDGVEELDGFVEQQVGLVGTNDNPFALYKQLEASKTSAPIGAGEVAPNDIVIPEGDTGIDPGPFVGDLQQVGANARIQEGSIQVLEDSTVLEAGGEVSPTLEQVLGELGIEPKEVGLDLRAVFADGVVFEPEDLALDVDEYRADVQAAAARARNLAINSSFPTAGTAPALLSTASGDAKALAVHAAIEDPDVIPDLVAKADSQLKAVAAAVDDEEALPEELRDVEVAAAHDADDEPEDESTDDQPAETEADDDDEDEEASGEGLGELFG